MNELSGATNNDMKATDQDKATQNKSHFVNRSGFRLLLFVVVLYYMLKASASWYGELSWNTVVAHGPMILLQVGVLVMLMFAHRLGHVFVSRHFGERISVLPWLIPGGWPSGFSFLIDSLPTSMQSQRQRVLTTLAGPIAGAIASATVFGVGLLFSEVAAVVEAGDAMAFRQSMTEYLFNILRFGLLPEGMVMMHNPLCLAANSGFWFVALHCLPMVPFDGAYALDSIAGRRISQWVSLVTAICALGVGVWLDLRTGFGWGFVGLLGLAFTVARSWKPAWFAFYFWGQYSKIEVDLSRRWQMKMLACFAVMFLLTVRFIWG